MKKLIYAIAIAATTMAGCKITTTGQAENEIKRERTDTFTHLVSNVVADINVLYHMDKGSIIEYDMPKNLFDKIEAKIENDVLTISQTEDADDEQMQNIKITIYTGYGIESCTQNGVGDMKLQERTLGRSFSANLVGVGDIILNEVFPRYLSAEIVGTGDIYLSGRCERADLKVTGVGDIDANGMIARTVSATLMGVGDISCHATDSLTTSSNGVGEITNSGNPTYTNAK